MSTYVRGVSIKLVLEALPWPWEYEVSHSKVDGQKKGEHHFRQNFSSDRNPSLNTYTLQPTIDERGKEKLKSKNEVGVLFNFVPHYFGLEQR